MHSNTVERPLLAAAVRGASRGVSTGWQLTRTMVPISLVVALAQWAGLLAVLSPVFEPLVKWIGLPAEAAVVLITAALVTVYAAIGAMSALTLDLAQVNILALMILVCHSLPVECAIQARAGGSAARIAATRIVTALVLGLFLHLALPTNLAAVPAPMFQAPPPGEVLLSEFLAAWTISTFTTLVKLFAIVIVLMVANETAREMGWLDALPRLLRPAMSLLGLPPEAASSWVTASFVGLTYGSGLIIQELREGRLDGQGSDRLHSSIGVGHSYLEDTLLFVAVGASLPWILFPRLAAAALVTRFPERSPARLDPSS